MNGVSTLSVEEMRANGVLLEVNRRLLHERGYALTAAIATDPQTLVPFSDEGLARLSQLAREAMDAGILSDADATELGAMIDQGHRVDAGDLISLYVRVTDDPEGWWFGDLDESDAAFARVFNGRASQRAHARAQTLGFFTEPLP